MKLKLSPAAIRDTKELYAYIAANDVKAAQNVATRLDKAVRFIGPNPQIGRKTPSRTTREWSVPGLPYVIPYRVTGDTVEILRIYHTSRKRPDHWR